MSDQDKGFQFKSITEPFEPWIRASKAWISEVEKLQQTTFENLTKTADESYKIFKDNLGTVSTINANLRKQWQAQLERTSEFIKSFLP